MNMCIMWIDYFRNGTLKARVEFNMESIIVNFVLNGYLQILEIIIMCGWVTLQIWINL